MVPIALLGGLDMQIHEIFRLIGIGLTLLGSASGVALFVRAVIGKEKISEGPGMSTLWGLFIFSLASGFVILIALSRGVF